MHSLWKWLLDLGWLVFLLLLWRHFWRDRKELLQTQSWLKTKGHVVRCEWVSEGKRLWPKIEYTYPVNEKDMVGEYLFLDTTHNNPNSAYSRQIAYQAAVAFKENKAIVVYYNPNQPEQSALDITLPAKLNLIIVLISLVIAFHLCLLWSQLLG